MSYDSVLVFKERHNPQLTELIAKYSEKRDVPAQTEFIVPGDNLSRIIYIQNGRTRHYSISADGVERVIYILNAGYFIGEGAFVSYVSKGKSTRYAKTETDCTLYWIDKLGYDKLMEHKLFAESLIGSSSKKNAFLRHEVENMSFLLLHTRLINLLSAAVDTSVTCGGEWHPIRVSLSQGEIGAILGANRVTVSKVIKKLTDDQVIRIVNRSMQIHKDYCTIPEGE